ncbi:MAG: T9SS type A sorting domain-containing protein [Saprospiraceae bacterium]|nr:T9SS type A sorting domain-containing protein [Saprospiraceae bacterium]
MGFEKKVVPNFTESLGALVAGPLGKNRYNTDGSLDSTFGNNGIVISDVGDGGIRKIALQTDAKIVAAGSVDGDFVLVRYLSGLEVGVVDFSSSQNTLFVYPNPIERETTLGYTLLADATLSIDLYDINGRLVQSLVKQGKRSAGEQKEMLNLEPSIVPGSYILVLSNGSGRLSLQIVKQ